MELADEITGLEEMSREIGTQLGDLKSERENVEAIVRRYDPGSELGPEPETPRLTLLERTADPADQVVALLSEQGHALHYKEIERLLRAAGLNTGSGQDPANALLATYYNDKRLYRPARGTYGLREWDPEARSVGSRKKRRRS